MRCRKVKGLSVCVLGDSAPSLASAGALGLSKPRECREAGREGGEKPLDPTDAEKEIHLPVRPLQHQVEFMSFSLKSLTGKLHPTHSTGYKTTCEKGSEEAGGASQSPLAWYKIRTRFFNTELSTRSIEESRSGGKRGTKGTGGFRGSWGSSRGVPRGLPRTSWSTGQVSHVSPENTAFKVSGENRGQRGGPGIQETPLECHPPLWATVPGVPMP